MYVSYSGYSKLDSCAFLYWLAYPGKFELDTPDDRLGSIFGTTVGRLFEHFYNNKVWRETHPQAFVMSQVDSILDDVLKEETSPSRLRKAGVLLWRDPSDPKARSTTYANRDEIAADVRDAVSRGFSIIRQHRLLGPRAEAEVKLDSDVEGHRLGGRADFIIHRTKPHHDRIILDGKGSRYRDKYVDVKQLLWYSMLLREREGVLPDRVGFVFWRFDAQEAVDWFEVTSKDVDDLLHAVITRIEVTESGLKLLGTEKDLNAVAEIFPKNPNAQNCRFCPYANAAVCPEGLPFVDKGKKKSQKKLPKV